MTAFMVITMDMRSEDWLKGYLPAVSALLAEYGAIVVAAGRNPIAVEGNAPRPDRVAVLSFPTLLAATAFLEDERYRPHRAARQASSHSEILVFESVVKPDGALR